MNIKSSVFTALFTSLIAIGAFIIIPAGFVPVSLQTLFVLLAGLLGGRAIGLSASLLYIILGAIGLPVFSGGTGGIGHLLGPTGGYLIACMPAAYIAGVFSDWGHPSRKDGVQSVSYGYVIAGALAGTLTIYLFGVPWLKFVLGLSWSQAAAAGIIPFLIGDILKIIAAAAVTGIFYPRIQGFLHSGAEG